MLERLLGLLGKPFVVPATFLLVGAWALNKLMALHDSKRRNRIEFLERWQPIEGMDDMRLEVTVRHLIGTYLPAHVIRAVYCMPFPTQALIELATIWPLARFDSTTKRIEWKRLGYGEAKSRLGYRLIFFALYVVSALTAFFFLYVATDSDPSKPMVWIAGFNTVTFFLIAISLLARSDMLGDVQNGLDAMVVRINAAMGTNAMSPATWNDPRIF